VLPDDLIFLKDPATWSKLSTVNVSPRRRSLELPSSHAIFGTGSHRFDTMYLIANKCEYPRHVMPVLGGAAGDPTLCRNWNLFLIEHRFNLARWRALLDCADIVIL